MTQAISEFKYQTLKGPDNIKDSTETEDFLILLYSRNIFPEKRVKSAIKKIEEDLEKNMVLLEKPQENSVVILKNPEPLKENYKLLQQWEGNVLEIKEDSFLAQLHDLSGNLPEEEAEISFEEISEIDRDLVEPGAFFYWNIGYHEDKSGQRTRSSMIRFRRLPAWTKREIEHSKRKAAEICKKLKWGTDANNIQSQASSA